MNRAFGGEKMKGVRVSTKVKQPEFNPGGLDQTPKKPEYSRTVEAEMDRCRDKTAEDTTQKTITINTVKQVPISNYTVTYSVAERARILSAASQHREAPRMSASFASSNLKS